MSDFSNVEMPSHAIFKHRNVEQIVKAAKEYEYNAQVPVRYWLRTAAALIKEADIYMREGDDETTYLLLFRHAHLVLAHLEAHPEAKDRSTKPLLAQARREVDRNLKLLDILKPRINQKYDEYQSMVRERAERRSLQLSNLLDEPSQQDESRTIKKRRLQQLHGHQDSDLAVRLAQQEYQRRANARDRSNSSVQQGRDEADDLSYRLQAVRARVEPSTKKGSEASPSDRTHGSHDLAYRYPSVRAQQDRQTPEYGVMSFPQQPTAYSRESLTPPALPPKPVGGTSASAPPRPEKVNDHEKVEFPAVNPSIGTTYTFAATATLENGNLLRTLFLPPTLRTTFLRIAYQNTKANLETCGFLAGTLISNALFVSKLIIPSQIATSDTCEMTNESQLFDYVDSGADLMILGWIHTHPSQTCFMSSRDLHTHAGYQMMLPESVAIVCAPSKGDTLHGGDWGVYRLTDPPGKMTVLNCTKPGVFHPHDVDNIYTDALRPGHVVEAKGLEFEVVDLRDN